jgi:hypothetical protein
VEQIETRDVLAAQERHGVGIGLLEDGGEQIPGLYLLLLGAFCVVQSTLHDSVKGQGLGGLGALFIGGMLVDILPEEAIECGLEFGNLGTAVAEDPRAVVVVNQRVEEMLDGQVGVVPCHGLADRRLDGEL